MLKFLNRFSRGALGLGCVLYATYAQGQTAHFLPASDFTEDFAEIASTTVWATPSKTDGSWGGFAATGSATIPNPNRTTASSAVFQSGNSTSGGIHRGTSQTTPAQNLVFLSTGGDNTSATALDLLLDFTNRNAGNLSFDAATVFNSTGNRQGTLSVYASVDGSTWTPVTGTNLPYIATNNLAGSASISVALPALLNNQAQGRLRFYYHNNNSSGSPSGSRPKISVDNVLVTSTSSLVGAPEVVSARTASLTAGSAFSYVIEASASPTSYSATNLPSGLTFNPATATISGSPTFPGVSKIRLSATNANGTGYALLTLTVSVNPDAPVISDQSTTATVGTAFNYQLVATNNPASYGASTLPPGLVLDSTTGIISGTPTVGGAYTGIQVSATNPSGSDSALLSIAVASAPILNGSFSGSLYLGQAFAYTVSASAAPQAPTFYDVTGLPDGMTYDGVTAIAGTPAAAGTYTFTITAGNSLGSDVKTFTLRVIEQATQDAIPLNVVINKYLNGTPDKLELLVVGSGAPGSTVDLRGMILKDYSGSMGGDAGGKYEFASNSLWSAVPAGTLIVLSAGATEPEDVSASDFVLRVNLGDTNYFTSLKIEASGNSAAFDIATTEMVMLKQSGYGALGVAGGIHALASGTAGSLYTAYTGGKLIGAGTTGTNVGIHANNTTSSLADYEGTDATGAIALASMAAFGSANNATNQTYIDSLRTVAHTALETWRFEKFGVYEDTGAVLAGDAEDFDGDGTSNLIEYATGTNPTVANASVVTTAKAGDFLTLSFPVISDSSLTYTVQASGDLGAAFTTGGGSTNTVGGVSTYTDNVSLSTAGVRRFLRLQVSYTE